MEYLNAVTFSYCKLRKYRRSESRAFLDGVNEMLLVFYTLSV